MDLDSAADELYGLPPGEFTAARDRLAAEARGRGDRELAAAIKKLKRPTVAAWLANLLSRERADDLDRLVTLAEGLREAQQHLDAGELRRLSQQRHEVVNALVGQARQIASRTGQPVSESVGRELQETLEAALSDSKAGEALRSGRLTGAISYSGLGFGDPGELVAVAPTAGRTRRAVSKRAERAESEGRDVDHQRELRDARAAAADAKRELDQQVRRARQLAKAADHMERRLEDLRHQVDDAEQQHAQTATESADAEQAVADAEAQLARARERLERAEAALG